MSRRSNEEQEDGRNEGEIFQNSEAMNHAVGGLGKLHAKETGMERQKRYSKVEPKKRDLMQ